MQCFLTCWPKRGELKGKAATHCSCLASSLHGSGSLSPLKGMEVSADPSALSTVIFAENPTFPNRIGTQRGYFESWMIEKPEASFLCCLKTDEALTHLINHIWRMQRSKNNLRFSQVLKWGHWLPGFVLILCHAAMIHSDATTLQYHYSTEDASAVKQEQHRTVLGFAHPLFGVLWSHCSCSGTICGICTQKRKAKGELCSKHVKQNQQPKNGLLISFSLEW